MIILDSRPYRKKTILVLYVGGTIGMQRNEDNVYAPVPDAFIQKIKDHCKLHDQEMAKNFGELEFNQLVLAPIQDFLIRYEIKEYDKLLDSSNMTPKDWIRIAKDIEMHYKHFDGFVILHGTDTITYTASALSFMLEGLDKPVILTGAQIPIFETRSDAKDNFLASLILAGCYDIPEVCICFANQLLRGNRTSKVSSYLLDAFKTTNYHTLADIGIDIKVHQHYIRKAEENKAFKVNTNLNHNVGLLPFFPTLTASMLDAFLKPPLQGLVLKSYGAGNIPSNNPEILGVLQKAVERELLIVNVTQCPHGSVHISYEVGKTLEDIGIISGADMTAEAALAKLCYVLGIRGLTYRERVQMIKTDLRGELTDLVPSNDGSEWSKCQLFWNKDFFDLYRDEYLATNK